MTYDEWKRISKRLAALYPASKLEGASVAAYLDVLGDLDARDVDAAARSLALEPERRWFPAPGRLRAQAEVERAARVEHERIPDVTGIHALPEGEREELLARGLEASHAIAAGEPRGEPTRIRDLDALPER